MPRSRSTRPRASSRRAKTRKSAQRPGLHLPQSPPRSMALEPNCTPRSDLHGRVAVLPAAASLSTGCGQMSEPLSGATRKYRWIYLCERAASGAGCFLTVSRLSSDPDITVYGLGPSNLQAWEESACPGPALPCLGTRSTELGAGRGLPGSYSLTLASWTSPTRFQDMVSLACVMG